jgi:hypothetical protein
MEGSAPSKMVEEPTHMFSIRRIGNVEAPATVGREGGRGERDLDECVAPGPTRNYSGSHSR